MALGWLAISLGAACSSPSPASSAPVTTSVEPVLRPASFGPSPADVAAHAAWTNAVVAAVDDASAAVPSQDGSTRYPAFTPDVAKFVSAGGAVIASPKIVTVTFDDDPAAAFYEGFDDAIGGTPYWSTLSEWGVGAASNGGHVHVAGAFPSLNDTFSGQDSTMQDYVRQQVLSSATSGWPAYTDQTIYALWLPANAALTLDGTPACDAAGSYHYFTATSLADGGASPSIVYAVVFNCGAGTDTQTLDASHELSETSTDPLGTTYTHLDPAHAAYSVYLDPDMEIADACAGYLTYFQEPPPPFDYLVSPHWTNSGFTAGHAPCAPRTDVAYYNATTFPSEMNTIHIDLTQTGYGGPMTTQGFKVPLGQSRTFDVGFYSDGPTAEWTLQSVSLPTLPIVDTSGNPLPNGDVTVTIEQPTGSNGHVARVTVTPTSSGTGIGASLIELQSGYAQLVEMHTLPILIGQN
jgi:hypothetical protein